MNNTKTSPIFNYTQGAWQGKNYDSNLDISEIAKRVKKELTNKFPKTKWSVRIQRYAGGQSMGIILLSAPFDPIKNPDIEIASIQSDFRTPEEIMTYWQRVKDSKNSSVNQFHYKKDFTLTDKAKEVMGYAIELVNSYNFDDSDAMVDYFHTNFYVDYSIGDWDKPFIINK